MAANNNSKNLNVPSLRFPGFTDKWVKLHLHDFVVRVTRKNKGNQSNLPLTISAQYGLVDQITFFNKKVASQDMSNYYLLNKGEFAYNKSYSSDYPWGAVKRLDRYDNGALSTLYMCFSPVEAVCSDYLVQYFESPKWYRGISEIAGEGARNHGLLNIAIDDYFNTVHYLPTDINEQKKIADFLSLLDERIVTQRKIIEDLKKLKSAIIDSYFLACKNGVRLGSLITEVSLRNKGERNTQVLSVSNRLGFIAQSDQFGERTIASDDTSNYKIVKKNDFAYNPARINVGSIARLVNFNEGIVSPMYLCFRCNEQLIPEYLEQYFESKAFQTEVEKRLEGSVRLCLSFDGLKSIALTVPPIEQQKNFAQRLAALQSKVDLEVQLLQLYQQQRQYMLSQMFI